MPSIQAIEILNVMTLLNNSTDIRFLNIPLTLICSMVRFLSLLVFGMCCMYMQFFFV